MKLLITGVGGFIGSNLSARLSRDGHGATALIREGGLLPPNLISPRAWVSMPPNLDELVAYMRAQKFDGVVHLASCYLREHTTAQITQLIESNLLFSTQVLEAACASGIPWFVNTGTFWQHYQDKDYSPVNLYAATKQAFEAIAQYYIEAKLITFTTLKLSDTYGPGDQRPKIFRLWSDAIKYNKVLEMSQGEQELDISYIDDVVEAYIALFRLLCNASGHHSLHGKEFAVSAGRTISLRALADIFGAVVDRPLQIKWGAKPYRKREVMLPWTRGVCVPGWTPKTSLEDGIRRTVETYG